MLFLSFSVTFWNNKEDLGPSIYNTEKYFQDYGILWQNKIKKGERALMVDMRLYLKRINNGDKLCSAKLLKRNAVPTALKLHW